MGTKRALLRKLSVLAVLTLVATEAQAEKGLFYLGAGVVHSSVSDLTPFGNPPPIDLKNTTWKAFVGVRPLNWLAAELDYIDLGSGSTSTPSYSPAEPYVASASGSTYAAYAVGFLPLPLPIVDFFAKVGFAGSKFNETVSAPQLSGTSSIKNWEFAWGLGVQAHFGIVGARLEYEQLDIPNSGGAKIASLSAFLNF
jgi:opacity protein-like surface antigen